MILLIEWAATVSGVVGAFLVASNTSASRWGFPIFLMSSIGFVLVGWNEELYGVLTLNTLFCIINGFGTYRWIIKP